MSRNGAKLPAAGPAMGDVARLFVFLTTEWVTDLEISIEAGHHTDGTPFIKLSARSERYADGGRAPYKHTWASRTFTGVDYKGSYNQLYDLLIVAYREIEKVLAPQERTP